MNSRPASTNLLLNLFRYHPREGFSPAENFLTEAFAYVVSTDGSAQQRTIERLTQGAIKGASGATVETQNHLRDETSGDLCIPDMIIRGTDAAGDAFEIWVENKWGSPLNTTQLTRYAQAIGRQSRGPRARGHLTFLAFDQHQVSVARNFMDTAGWPRNIGRTALTWRDLHQAMDGDSDAFTLQFLAFLDEHGLGAIPRITLPMALGYANLLANRRLLGGRGRFGFNEELRIAARRQCDAALATNQIDGVGGLENATTDDAYGRVTVYHADEQTSVGLLYDVADHRTAFVDPTRPLDICVRVQMNEVGLSEGELAALRVTLQPLRAELEQAGFDCSERGVGWANNRHSALLGHFRSGYPWDAPNGNAQVAELAQIFAKAWVVLNRKTHRTKIDKLPAY